MKIKIIGKRIFDYKDKKTKESKKGILVFYQEPDNPEFNNGVEGTRVDSIFLSPDYFDFASIPVNTVCNMLFNRGGFPECIIPLKE